MVLQYAGYGGGDKLGLVGIGTSVSDGSKLRVKGDVGISGDLRVSAGKKVGIGTYNANYELTVIDNITLDSAGSTDDTILRWEAGAATKWRIINDTEVAGGTAHTLNFTSAGAANVSINQAGNVGIGTKVPTYTLDVAGDIGVNEYIYHNDDTNTYLRFQSDHFGIRTAGADRFIIAGAETVVNEDQTDSDFRVESNSQAHTLFVEAGTDRVGIGTALPSGILHVNNAGTGIIVANEQITGNAFEVHGAQGNLFTITDDLSDSLMSVNDAAGMPVFEVFADDTIKSYRNNESKFEVDPDNNRIRLRDNLDVSGMAVISGTVGIGTASMGGAGSLKLYNDGAAGGARLLDIGTDNGLIFSVVNYHQNQTSCYLRTEGSMYIGTDGDIDALIVADASITCNQTLILNDIASYGAGAAATQFLVLDSGGAATVQHVVGSAIIYSVSATFSNVAMNHGESTTLTISINGSTVTTAGNNDFSIAS
jgi:hypothetical protein